MDKKDLRKQVYEANMELVEKKLVISTWGNVSGYDEQSGLMAIKPSGVPYSSLTPDMIVLTDLNGNTVDSELNPSTDTPTHIELYKRFRSSGIKGIVHTHSQYATVWAQLARDIPCLGTTHCDYFFGDIPCTRGLTAAEIDEAYEKNTGKVIIETFEAGGIDPAKMRAVLVRSHAPFCWGKDPHDSVANAEVLEYIAKMAIFDLIAAQSSLPRIDENIKMKHHNRKFGAGAYYGQPEK